MAYSIQRATSDGTLSRLLISLKYFDKTDLHVYVNGLVLPQDGTTGNGYKYVWDGTSIVITPVIPAGIELMVRRTTKFDEPYHLFDKGAVFKDSTVDDNFAQAIYLMQEATEGATQTDFYSDLNFHGYRLTKVGNALADDDAVPLAQYKADAAGSYQNRVATEAARVDALNSRNASAASQAAAATSEANALSYKNSAATSATNAATSEANALASKNAAATSATNAANSASAAATSAANAQSAEAVVYAGTIAVVMAIALG